MASRFIAVILLLSMFFGISCTSSKKITYFKGALDTDSRAILGRVEAPYQKGDILNISVSSLNPKFDVVYNKIDNNVTKGYLINEDGNIQMPKLGNVSAAGLTKKQLIEKVASLIVAQNEILNPIVEIRHLNFEVTVLGEVNNPSVITVPSEQISLVKAVGLAGDLTIFGKRENILLIREENGYRSTQHVNINSADFLSSEYYYLKPNDVVYVEPNKTKIASTDRSQQIIPVVLSGISILILVLDRVIK